MKKLFAVLVIAGATCLAVASDETPPAGGMPEMGPPAELKQLATMVGMWDVVNKERQPGGGDTWTESKATCEFHYTVGGGALETHYTGTFMGKEFRGQGLWCWNRFTKEWQMVWTESMMAFLMNYTGKSTADGFVFEGWSEMMGHKYGARLTYSKVTPNSFEWKYEESLDGGKTWLMSVTSVYTKRA